MNITNAIKTARRRIGEIYRFGDNYQFDQWDESVNAWRSGTPQNYFVTQSARSRRLICEAMWLMGYDDDTAYYAMADYVKGSWVDHLRSHVNRGKQ